MSAAIRRLGASDADAMRALNALFATEFEDPDSYAVAPPSEAYLREVLNRPDVIVLTAADDGQIVGGLVAYVLAKLEKERSEIYIYDLAVAEAHRRQGIATALIGHLQDLAAKIGAWVIYVQADYGDDPAVALYEKLGLREDVMHFDITPRATR
jgi:aminoglycoside 3-N-acetyltransferase I